MTQPVPADRTGLDLATAFGYDLGYVECARDIADALRAKAEEIRATPRAKYAAIVEECAVLADRFTKGVADVDS